MFPSNFDHASSLFSNFFDSETTSTNDCTTLDGRYNNVNCCWKLNIFWASDGDIYISTFDALEFVVSLLLDSSL